MAEADTGPAAAGETRTGVGEALARYYDMDLVDDPGDVDMYLAFADAGDGPVLELGAGSGRVCVPLAQAGHEVWAVDRDKDMLARAGELWQRLKPRAGGGDLHLVEEDIKDLRLEKRFGLVVLALNSLLLLDGRDGMNSAFAAIATHLAPDGRAVIDVWLPTPEDLALYDGRLVLDWVRTDDETGDQVSKSTSARYEPAARVAHVTSFFDAWRDSEPVRRMTRTDRISFVSAAEVQSMAEASGLSVDTIAGDYEMGRFAPDSDRLVMVCRPGPD